MLLLVEQLFFLSSIQKTKNELVLQDFRFQWFCVGISAVLTHAYRRTSILAKGRTCLVVAWSYWQVQEHVSNGRWETGNGCSRWAQVDARFRGKSRVVFNLKLDMESARISINKEDGMLAQDDFRFDLKVSFVELLHWDFFIIFLTFHLLYLWCLSSFVMQIFCAVHEFWIMQSLLTCQERSDPFNTWILKHQVLTSCGPLSYGFKLEYQWTCLCCVLLAHHLL